LLPAAIRCNDIYISQDMQTSDLQDHILQSDHGKGKKSKANSATAPRRVVVESFGTTVQWSVPDVPLFLLFCCISRDMCCGDIAAFTLFLYYDDVARQGCPDFPRNRSLFKDSSTHWYSPLYFGGRGSCVFTSLTPSRFGQ